MAHEHLYQIACEYIKKSHELDGISSSGIQIIRIFINGQKPFQNTHPVISYRYIDNNGTKKGRCMPIDFKTLNYFIEEHRKLLLNEILK